MGSPSRIRIGALPVDVLTFDEALSRIVALAKSGEGGFVVTPNVDHVVLADEDPRFLAAYEAASLSLVDGFPLLVTARLFRTPLPEKISGSDLCVPLLERAAKENLRVYFLGAGPGVADEAKQKLEARIEGLQIVGTDSPKVDLDGPDSEKSLRAITDRIAAAKPDIVLVALGAPKQELLCHRIAKDVRPAVLLGIGATLDFIAGRVKRAPPWMSKVGLEWAFRLGQEPKRLFHRYVIRDSKYPGIVLRHRLRNSR